jgi:hypothetical protein
VTIFEHSEYTAQGQNDEGIEIKQPVSEPLAMNTKDLESSGSEQGDLSNDEIIPSIRHYTSPITC